jgi:hypothetical protein
MRTIFLLLLPLLVAGCVAKKPAAMPQYTGLTSQAGAVSGNLGHAREGGEGVRSHLRESTALLDRLDNKAASLLAE